MDSKESLRWILRLQTAAKREAVGLYFKLRSLCLTVSTIKKQFLCLGRGMMVNFWIGEIERYVRLLRGSGRMIPKSWSRWALSKRVTRRRCEWQSWPLLDLMPSTVSLRFIQAWWKPRFSQNLWSFHLKSSKTRQMVSPPGGGSCKLTRASARFSSSPEFVIWLH